MNVAVMPSRLDQLEHVIERGLATFVEVGEALLAIRDERLYRETHATFEDYCRERWGFSRSRADRLISASEVAHLMPRGITVPSERVAREIAPLARQDPDAAALVLSEAKDRSGAEEPSTAAVRAVVKEYLHEEQPIEDERDDSMWAALTGLMESLALLTANDAARVAATVPPRRRAATARRLRDLGRYLGRIAWTLEGNGGDSE